MSNINVDPAHFARAVTELGDKRPVVARSPIVNTQGLKIIDRGIAIDARLYERLTQHQLKQPLAESLGTEPVVTGRALREAVVALCRDEPLFEAMLASGRLRQVLSEELELVPLPAAMAFQLTLLRESRPDGWLHALRCAVTAAWLGERLSGARHDLRMLAAAGLVHDLGMLHLDPVLSQPEVDLGADQRRQLYSHPLVTVMLLERHHEFPRELLRAVLEHHEALDGGGYPRGVAGAAIGSWGRILALAEVVASVPADRLSLALRLDRHRFDPDLLAGVLALIPAAAAPAATSPALDSVQALQAIESVLDRWPATAPDGTPHGDDLLQVQSQAARIRRQMAEAGAASAQLALLEPDSADDALRAELQAIVREMAWQLRTLVRRAQRRWRGRDGDRPDWLAAWLADAEAVCRGLLST